jgi:hypothetical protein
MAIAFRNRGFVIVFKSIVMEWRVACIVLSVTAMTIHSNSILREAQ